MVVSLGVFVLKVVVLALLALFIVLVSWRRTLPYRHWVALGVGVAALVLGLVPLNKLLEYVDLDVIGLVLGMSIMTVYMNRCGLADAAAAAILRRVGGLRMLVFLITLLAGVVSIALENVTVVLMIAPVAFSISSRLGIDPRPLIIGVALASNMAGSATMIGDPPAIITAGYFKLSFGDFIVYRGRPSMFFYTLLAMILACMVLSVTSYPRARINVERRAGERVVRDPVFLAETCFFLSLKILLLSLRTSLGIPLTAAAAVGVGGLTLARLFHRDTESVRAAFQEGFEWRVALFLFGVFILSGAFKEQGLADDLANLIAGLGWGFLGVTSLLVAVSVAVSAFIDNVPYVATMLPVVDKLHEAMGVDPVLLAWSMLLGATLGGNLTYIGASANVVAVRLLEKEGHRVYFGDFLRLSIPFNTVSVLSGWLAFELTWLPSIPHT